MIPKLFHFIYLGETDFYFHHYLAIANCFISQKCPIYLHYLKPPDKNNIWWRKALKFVTLVRAREVQSCNNEYVAFYQHKADILRLEILQKYGGIYLDLDYIIIKNISKLCEENEFVVFEEKNQGISNAFLCFPPNNDFINEWLDHYYNNYLHYDKYEGGASEYWVLKSVKYPGKLYKEKYEGRGLLLEEKMVFPFLYDFIFHEHHAFNSYPEGWEDALGMHLWQTEFLKVNPDNDTIYKTCMQNPESFFYKKAIDSISDDLYLIDNLCTTLFYRREGDICSKLHRKYNPHLICGEDVIVNRNFFDKEIPKFNIIIGDSNANEIKKKSFECSLTPLFPDTEKQEKNSFAEVIDECNISNFNYNLLLINLEILPFDQGETVRMIRRLNEQNSDWDACFLYFDPGWGRVIIEKLSDSRMPKAILFNKDGVKRITSVLDRNENNYVNFLQKQYLEGSINLYQARL